jgi:Flp pilus assembly protein TadG
MLRRFIRDKRGNYMLLTAVSMVPIMGSLAIAIDYSQMARHRQETLNALDAAGIAAARLVASGATDTAVKSYAKDFFEANLGSVKPANTILTVTLPKDNGGGGTLKLSAALKYEPYFFPAFAQLIGKDNGGGDMKLDFQATSEVKLKNTLEIALVLDNSGSMDFLGSGSGKKRMTLLKEAAKQLVDTIATEGQQMKQLPKPVQFGVVPFAASVNVGASNKTAAWMDTNGLSPIHHEIFTYPNTTTPTASAMYTHITYARGNGWASLGDGWKTLKDKPLTRFTFFDNVKRRTGTSGGLPTYAYISWEGCVEARPYPYNVNDAAASTATPATLFVPMFAPDEVGNVWVKQSDGTLKTFNASNSWWDDQSTSTSTGASTQLARQKKASKYFVDMPQTTNAMPALHAGPNSSCTTKEILPLTDVSTTTGVTTVKNAIDAMEPNGATNVPEGMAWGWRVISSGAPFTQGRAETEKGNDKVVIVLTDGANTYYTPTWLGFADNAGMKSTYSSYGYAGQVYSGSTTTRLFMNTSTAVVKTDFSEANYTRALNEQFASLCANAKAAGVIVMTVSLDLSSSDTTEKGQIDALKACSSESRFRKGTDGKPAKLYWNTTGANLSASFKEIADELSNLRIVS